MKGNRSKDSSTINKLKSILNTNLEDEHFGVKELAKEAGLSRSSLHRKVHAYNGNSTSQFIREFRLQKAMEFLRNEDITVSEVAYNVGFSSPTYFNTCFKDYYGYPPGELKYRTKITENQGQSMASESTLVTPRRKIPFKSYKGIRVKRKWIVLISLVILAILFAVLSFYKYNKNSSEIADSNKAGKEKSIAVLPFKNWSGDPNLEYISDGMTDAVITRLNKIESFTHVIPFTSVLRYKLSEQDIPTIANELGVKNILQGNFQLSGDQMKIVFHLIDADSNKSFWSQEYTGIWKTDEIFRIQAEVTEKIAERMDLDLSEKSLTSIRAIPTKNTEAYVSWLQGNYQYSKYNKKGFENAIELYQKAIALDSTFIEPHVRLSYIYLFGGASWGLYTEQEAWGVAKYHLSRALTLDSTNLQAKSALNDGLYIYEWDFDRMEKVYLDNSNLTWIYCLNTGRFEELLPLINSSIEYISVEQNQSLYMDQNFKVRTLYHMDSIKEAKKILDDTEGLFDDQIMFLRIASRYYYYMGDLDKSNRMLTKLLNTFPDRPPVVLWLCAVHAQRNGETEQLGQYLGELRRRYELNKSGSPAWFIALYYSCIGDYDNALLWLEKSYSRHEVEMIWLREEPALRPLRPDPLYKELYHKVGFPMPPHPF